MFENIGESRGRRFDPPIDFSQSDGVDFACEFDNPRDVEVGYGVGDQEMCVMLGFADSSWVYDVSIKEGAHVGETNGLQEFTGECNIVAIPRSSLNRD